MVPESAQYRKIKDLCADDQPRERAEKYGCSVLATADLLALILRTGTPGNPITRLCRELLEANNQSLKAIERRTRKELMQHKGIGKTKAIQIEAIMELIKRYNGEGTEQQPIIRSSADAYAHLKDMMGNKPHEEFRVIYCNRANRIISTKLITTGTSTATLFDLKTILKNALLENAEALLLAHNHPSGQLRPSIQDDGMTRAAAEGCKTMGITLLDHIIITASGYYSYRDEGKL